MKKLIISVAILIFIMSSILWFGIKKMPDNGIYKKGSSKSLDDCLAVLIDNGVDSRYSTAKEHEKYIEKMCNIYNIDDMDILYVTSTDKNEYNIRNTSYSFIINKVIKGKDYINGKEIIVQIRPETLFQELDDEGLKLLEDYYNSIGLSEKEFPWLYSKREVYYSSTSVPKEGDNYIIFIGKINYSNEKEPMYLLLNNLMFAEADVSNDRLLKYEDVPIYKNYANNYTFFFKQEDLEWYINLKNDIFNYYLK